MNINIQAALIGLLAGLIGGTVTAAASHFFGLEASRQELLQTASVSAYIDWLDIRQLAVQADRLREENIAEAAQLDKEYDLKAKQVFGRIGVYGDQAVVRAVATWARSFKHTKSCVGPMQRWKPDINIYQSMRSSLIPDEQAVSDTDLSIVIFGCSEPTRR